MNFADMSIEDIINTYLNNDRDRRALEAYKRNLDFDWEQYLPPAFAACTEKDSGYLIEYINDREEFLRNFSSLDPDDLMDAATIKMDLNKVREIYASTIEQYYAGLKKDAEQAQKATLERLGQGSRPVIFKRR